MRRNPRYDARRNRAFTTIPGPFDGDAGLPKTAEELRTLGLDDDAESTKVHFQCGLDALSAWETVKDEAKEPSGHWEMVRRMRGSLP